MANPLVSILIPAWNAAAWISETIESALAQTHPNIEIIIVDDGSRDTTLNRARGFESGKVKVVTQANAGASAARNHALRLAQGDFIQFLDADDLLSPRKIELQLADLANRPPLSVATCRWGRFEQNIANANFVDEKVFRDFVPIDFLLLHIGEACMMHPAAWLVPRSVQAKVEPWNENLTLNDDGEYFARVVSNSVGIAFTSDPNAASYYRSHRSSSLSGRRSRVALASLELAAHHVAQLVMAQEDSPRSRQALANFWQYISYELYPEAASASRAAEARAATFGTPNRSFPGGEQHQLMSRWLGWRFVRRLQRLRAQLRS